jgi:hypothetical protein
MNLPDYPVAIAYAKAIKRGLGEQLNIDPKTIMVTWVDDETIHATFDHEGKEHELVFGIGSDDDDEMEFVALDGGYHVVVTLTDNERSEVQRLIDEERASLDLTRQLRDLP